MMPDNKSPALILSAIIACALSSSYLFNKNSLSSYEQNKQINQVIPSENSSAAAPPSPDSPPAGSNVQSVEVMAERLKTKLQKDPKNPEGWVLLGKSYAYMEQWDNARSAYQQARKYGFKGKIPQNILNEGQASSASQHNVEQNAHSSLLAESIQSTVNNKGEAHSSNQKATKSQPREQTSKSLKKVAKPFKEGIPIKVSISDKIKDKLSDNDTVFIFAKIPNGPKPPVAVLKRQVKDLPLSITMNDSMSMVPAYILSSSSEIKITARISKSNSIERNKGDFEVTTDIIQKTPKKAIHIVIDKPV